MKNLILLCSFAVLFSGCGHRPNYCKVSSKFRVINNAASNTLVEVSPATGVTATIKVKASRRSVMVLCFDKVPKNDGSYLIHVKHAQLDTTFKAGYYTNGGPLGNGNITITNTDVKYTETSLLY